MHRFKLCWQVALSGVFACVMLACNEPYRIGEYVWVEWEEGKLYPAYITEKKSRTRYRVHFDGYDTRWDDDVSLDRIKGRIEGEVSAPPPPKKVQRAAGFKVPKVKGSAAPPVSLYKIGDRVRVRWRGSVYAATVVGVVDKDKYLVHYDGHESAWDEAVHVDRIVNKR